MVIIDSCLKLITLTVNGYLSPQRLSYVIVIKESSFCTQSNCLGSPATILTHSIQRRSSV